MGVLVVAYNAATTLAQVLDRLPESFRHKVDHVLVCDDASSDSTYLVGLGYQSISDLPLTVMRHPVNLGYGGNQKAGYRWAIENELDIVVLLHGDGQYAPEVIEELIRPLEEGRCDAVFGSRMLDSGSARSGGMPMYKYVGNRILTKFENSVAGLDLSEWHSGYRAYSVDVLASLPFENNSDDFDFDTEIILQLHEAGCHICEVPIPTYYGDEICHVNGMRYAFDVARDVTRYRLHKMGFGTGDMAFGDDAYELKMTPTSSHGRLLSWMSAKPPMRVLDVGCSDGRFAELLREQGHKVTGIDLERHEGVENRVDDFIQADLNQGLPDDLHAAFDVVIAADVLEHTLDPIRLLREMSDTLVPGGTVLVSVPNFAHWYPRARVSLGRFDYDRRGILDSGHVRFFTRRSLDRAVEAAGLTITKRETVGLPLEVAERGGAAPTTPGGVVSTVDRVAANVWPTMFGYQFLLELRSPPTADD